MLKYHLVFICLFSSGFFIYLPLNYMDFDLNIDYLCYYADSNNIYVKSCEKGQYCQKFKSNIGKCQNFTEDLISKLGEDCESNFQCDKELICDASNKCSINTNNQAYKVLDSDDKNTYYYYCPSEYIPTKSETSYKSGSNFDFDCSQKYNDFKGKCFDLSSKKRIFPEYSKVCGKIITSNNVEYVNISEIGEIEENEFVEDERACKSGYALYFYEDKQLKNPTANMFKLCVNFKESKKVGNGCRIKYTLKDEKEYIYNSNMLDSQFQNDKLFTECVYISRNKIVIF